MELAPRTRTNAPVVLHLETFLATRGGEPIRVICDCAFGRDHRTERGVAVAIDR